MLGLQKINNVRLVNLNEKYREKYDNRWNQEVLYTVLSLQEGIGRLIEKRGLVIKARVR